jgi:hypothetical protein
MTTYESTETPRGETQRGSKPKEAIEVAKEETKDAPDGVAAWRLDHVAAVFLL